MPHRHPEVQEEDALSFRFEPQKVKLFAALRERFRRAYSVKDFSSDLMSGVIVGLVALPLGMALAIASGVPPQHGLYTIIIAGFLVALIGGSRFQVTGPTAAFVVVLLPIVERFGLGGLLLAGSLAGFILMAMGALRMGRLIEFIPHPVTTGFTSGIAVVIATLQIKDFFGLQITKMPDSYFEKWETLIGALPTISPVEVSIACITLFILLIWPKAFLTPLTFGLNKKIPSPLVALGVVTIGSAIAKGYFPELNFATIQSKFSYVSDGQTFAGIPHTIPHFRWPWDLAGPNGEPLVLNFQLLRHLLPPAFAIAMLGAIESLLSAVIADGMAKTKHDPDAELFALGIGNIVCPAFGGIPATGAIARTATNIRFGARSPLSAMIHAVFVLLVLLLFASYVGYLPMASMAALLVIVAYNMSEIKHFKQIVKVAPRSDVFVLLICFFLTVVFDMVIGVTTGVVLAALLFMARMSSLTSGHLVPASRHPSIKGPLPESILLYEIAGPLFFGAAQKAIAAMSNVAEEIEVVIFDLSSVPILDVTGLVALESCFQSLHAAGKTAIITGIRKQPASVILRTHLLADQKKTFLAKSLSDAIEHAKNVVKKA